MKIKEVSLSNFAKYDQVTVSFDDNITYLVGKNGSGKSTLGITAVWFMFQGIAEKATGGNNPLIGERFRFIGPKAATAKGEMILWDEKKSVEIKVMRKLTKSGSELSFEAPMGYDLSQQWLTDLFNLFLIAPKKFTELSPKDQAKALGIDTKVYDDAIAFLKTEYTVINRQVKEFGEIPVVEKTQRVDVSELQAEKNIIKEKLNEKYLENKKHNEQLRDQWQQEKLSVEEEVENFNVAQDDKNDMIEKALQLLRELNAIGYSGNDVQTWIITLPKPEPYKVLADLLPKEPEYIPELPDQSELNEIDQRILMASETNQQAFLYEQYILRLSSKALKEGSLKENKKKQDEKEQERLDYIKSFKFPFSNLSVGEDGELLLNGKPIKEPYFSTGELLKVIPILIANQNPELKYVFLQDFNLMDEEKQAEVADYLTGKGFQLVIEMVGKEKFDGKNCILLKDNVVVDDYQANQPELA